jgi:hypothetical protein
MRLTMRCLAVFLALLPAIDATGQTGFVRVSPRDPRYFETTDGKPFIPIGMNMISPPWDKGNAPEQKLAGLDEWLGQLQANGANFFRDSSLISSGFSHRFV